MRWGQNTKYGKYLNKDDPIDSAILELIEEGKLKVGFVKINDRGDMKDYSQDILLDRSKNLS